MAFGDASKRKVRVSKNKKKSWNKHCDVKEVEDYLEEKRFEERIGWPITGKSSEELFFQDTSASDKLEKPKRVVETLKCHQNLGAYSNVPPPVNLDVNRYPKRIKKVLEKKAEKRAKKVIVQNSKKEKNVNDIQKDLLKDPWAEDEEPDEEIRDLISYRDEITEKRTPNVPCHRFQKPSLLPAVEVPHAGASYNPSYEEHQELLRKAVDVEEKHVKEELHLKRVLNDMFPSKANAPTEKTILEEMAQGLFDEEEEEEESVNHFTLRNPPVLADDRLPKSRHRKRRELKEEARKRAEEKLHKQRLHEIYRIPSLKSEIKKEQELTKQRIRKKFERKVEKMYNPKTLSGHKYQPPDIEVSLTEEITGSLRKLKADGNLIEDRYKSLQRRNLIEPRIKQKMKRKYKLKRQVKRSHRNFE